MTHGGSEKPRCFWCGYGDANKEGVLSHNKVNRSVAKERFCGRRREICERKEKRQIKYC